jgi:hypothetical protein
MRKHHEQLMTTVKTINKLTLEPKFMMPEARLNPVALAEIATFDAKRKPPYRWN